jgi:hypothetical protein
VLCADCVCAPVSPGERAKASPAPTALHPILQRLHITAIPHVRLQL